MSTPVPPPVSHPLIMYVSDDLSVWGFNVADGHGYQITGPEGAPLGVAIYDTGSGGNNP